MCGTFVIDLLVKHFGRRNGRAWIGLNWRRTGLSVGFL
jgi:hypothetical protein